MSSFNSVSVDLVLLGKCDGELVLLDASVQVRGDSSEFEELMSFTVLSESELIEVFVRGDRLTEVLVVVSFEVDFVQAFVDFLVIRVLNALQERCNQSDVSSLSHDRDALGEIDLCGERSEEFIDLLRLFI